MSFEAPSYLATLREFVDGYRGKCQRSILRAGDVFELYMRLFVEGDLSREERGMVNAVLAYFIVPEDILPEDDLGPYGLLDDLYVAAHVYRILRRDSSPALVKAWRGDGELDDVMNTVYSESRGVLGKRTRQVLRMAGLG